MNIYFNIKSQTTYFALVKVNHNFSTKYASQNSNKNRVKSDILHLKRLCLNLFGGLSDYNHSTVRRIGNKILQLFEGLHAILQPFEGL